MFREKKSIIVNWNLKSKQSNNGICDGSIHYLFKATLNDKAYKWKRKKNWLHKMNEIGIRHAGIILKM